MFWISSLLKLREVFSAVEQMYPCVRFFLFARREVKVEISLLLTEEFLLLWYLHCIAWYSDPLLAIKSIPRELIDRNLDSKYKGYLGDEDAEFDETQMYELLQSEI